MFSVSVHDAAVQVERAIKDGNGCAWPLTIQQARRTAQAYGLRLDLVPRLSPVKAALIGRQIHLAVSPDDPIVTLVGRAIHEIAEALARRLRPQCDRIFAHRVAELVEWRARAWLIHVPEEEDVPAPLPIEELTYVRDEYCDPLGGED